MQPININEKLWDCFNSGHIPPVLEFHDYFEKNDNDEDTITVQAIRGLKIYRHPKNGTARLVGPLPLNNSNLEAWMQDEDASGTEAESLSAKLLFCEQIVSNDNLRPGGEVKSLPSLSKRRLAEHLSIAPFPINRMGTVSPWMTFLPPRTQNDTVFRYAMGAAAFSMNWAYDSKSGTNKAFIAIHSYAKDDPSSHMEQVISHMTKFSHTMLFLPYLAVDTLIQDFSSVLVQSEVSCDREGLELERLLHKRGHYAAFSNAAARLGTLDILQRTAQMLITSIPQIQHTVCSQAQQLTSNTIQKGYSIVPADPNGCSQHMSDLLALDQAITYRLRELQQHMYAIASLIRRTDLNISAIFGLMSSKSQEISSEIARATKEDGRAMKTLAVVSIIFLPWTAVASVLAIPVFRWDAVQIGDVASSRVWIFFAASIPLTIIIMLGIWIWMREQPKHSRDKFV